MHTVSVLLTSWVPAFKAIGLVRRIINMTYRMNCRASKSGYDARQVALKLPPAMSRIGRAGGQSNETDDLSDRSDSKRGLASPLS